MAVPKLCVARLAVQSLKCAFGGSEDALDSDATGELHPKQVECPLRGAYPFSGYGHRKARLCGCRPIYELDLPPRQLELAELLVNTGYETADIARLMEVSEGYVRKKTSEIYASMEVANRLELMPLLRGKRLV